MRTLLSTCLLAGLVLGLSLPNLPTQAATQLDALANQFNLYPVASKDMTPTFANHGGEHDDEEHGDHHRNANLANGHDHDGDHGEDDHDHHRNASLANGHDGHDDDDHDNGDGGNDQQKSPQQQHRHHHHHHQQQH
jgi:hypothetical protein